MCQGTRLEYLLKEKKYGLRLGDFVKVFRKFHRGEDGAPRDVYWERNYQDRKLDNILNNQNRMVVRSVQGHIGGVSIIQSSIFEARIWVPYFILAKCDIEGNILEYPPGYEPSGWNFVASKVDDSLGFNEDEF